MFCLHVHVCHMHTRPLGTPEGVSDPLDMELELEMIMNRHMGDGGSAREPRTPALLFIRKRILISRGLLFSRDLTCLVK